MGLVRCPVVNQMGPRPAGAMNYPGCRGPSESPRSGVRGHIGSRLINDPRVAQIMTWKTQYEKAKPKLLSDSTICAANRALFSEFFAFEEYKLKRSNGLPDLDEGCCITLYGYIMRLRNVNTWFENKPWVDLTREDIKRVYDALEDGAIRTRRGVPFQDRHSYYNKIFKSKPFRLAGKDDLVREVIEFSTRPKQPVRYITEEVFRSLVEVVGQPKHLLLLWLAWDIGENISTLLQLTKREFILQVNRDTGEREYLVQLPAAKLKRSRQARSEVTLYPETVRAIDRVLTDIGSDERVFAFGYRQALKLFRSVVRRSGARTMPLQETVRWKDLRSGMACHLLKNGWSRDEVNARLGHTPSSDTLDAYINFLSLDRNGPKRRLAEANALARQREARALVPPGHEEGMTLKSDLVRAHRDIEELRRQVEILLTAAQPQVAVKTNWSKHAA